MSEKFTSLIAAIATTLTIFVATAPAGAQERPITVTATEERVPVRYVSYRDLNLARTEDEQILVGRVRHAARDVCRESVPFNSANFGLNLSCRSEAWLGARPQIALAVTRAREIAANGFSAIAPVAISISVR